MLGAHDAVLSGESLSLFNWILDNVFRFFLYHFWPRKVAVLHLGSYHLHHLFGKSGRSGYTIDWGHAIGVWDFLGKDGNARENRSFEAYSILAPSFSILGFTGGLGSWA